MTSHPRRWSYL